MIIAVFKDSQSSLAIIALQSLPITVCWKDESQSDARHHLVAGFSHTAIDAGLFCYEYLDVYNNNTSYLVAHAIELFVQTKSKHFVQLSSVVYKRPKQKQTNFISYQLQYIEKHDHPSRMTISKLKKHVNIKNLKT